VSSWEVEVEAMAACIELEDGMGDACCSAMRYPTKTLGAILVLNSVVPVGCGGTAVSPSPAPTPGPAGRFLYATDTGATAVSSFTLDSAGGQITPRGEARLSGGSRVLSVAVDPTGRFLFVARMGGGIDVFTIDRATGSLTLATGSPFDTLRQAEALSMHPSGRFLWATRTFNSAIESFAVDSAKGALAHQSTLSLNGTTPTATAVHPDGVHMFFASGTVATIHAAVIDATTGRLSVRASVGVPDSVRSLTVHPAGAFLYVTTATPFSSDTLFVYRIGGALSRASESVFASGFDPAAANLRPGAITFDATGRFAYVLDRSARTGVHSRGVFVFPVQPSGVLGPSVLGPFSTPSLEPLITGDPAAFALDPSGRFAYLADASARTISAFTVDATTGGLSPSGSPRVAPPGIGLLAITQ
jgi:6-phosphogluconolactonase